MNLYNFACAIFGLVVFLAVLLWALPRARAKRAVELFHSQLENAEAITAGWRQWLLEHDPSDDVPTPTPAATPPGRRSRRDHRHPHAPEGDEPVG